MRLLTWWLRVEHVYTDLRDLYRANRERRRAERNDGRVLEGDALLEALRRKVEPPKSDRNRNVLPFSSR